MPAEFELIRRYFTRPNTHTDLGIGDDAALFRPRSGMQLAISTDMLVAGTHFFTGTDPYRLGWKTLAVNLSDLAAMGAAPYWALLAAALPSADEDWIQAFANGFFTCATRYGVDIIGGDTTRGPLTLSVTIAGEVPCGNAVTRAGAHPHDDLWVSGYPGRAALGLLALQQKIILTPAQHQTCTEALEYPIPRIELGQALRGIATAMLDISDGLLGDLKHILTQSRVGAIIDIPSLPYPYAPFSDDPLPPALVRQCILTGGDDYELLFTAPPAHRPTLTALTETQALPLTRIGHITNKPHDLLLKEQNGELCVPEKTGYQHFA